MTTAADWRTRVGDVWAVEWRRTDRSFTELSARLNSAILAAAPTGPAAVLDIGCGAGGTSAALATARPDLQITGVDLSPALIEVARRRVPGARFRVADAAIEALEPADLIISRHGVMFFADPTAAFARLRAAARPGAALVFTCFATRNLNAFAETLVAEVMGAAPPPLSHVYAPGPFAFADQDFVADLLANSGWLDAEPERIMFGYIAGEGDDPVIDAVSFLTRIGPVATAIHAAPDADRAGLTVRLGDALARYRVGDRVVLPASAWLWRARAGESA